MESEDGEIASELDAVLDVVSDGVLVLDIHGEVVAANREARRVFGFDDSPHGGVLDAAVLNRSAPWLVTLTDTSSSGTVVGVDGVPRRVRASVAAIPTGRIIGLVDHRGASDAIDGEGKQLLAWYQTILSRSTDVVCVFDRLGQLQWASRSMFGYERGGAVGTHFIDFIHPDDIEPLADSFGHLLSHDGATASIQVRIRPGDMEEWRHVDVVGTSHIGDEEIAGLVVNIRDVTQRAEATARLEWQAFHDPLTSLPNRTLLLDRMQQAVVRSERDGTKTAVLFVDVDHFKAINDTHGHDAGDRILRTIAERLRSATRDVDTVARLGGDEFVVLYEQVPSPEQLHDACGRVIAAVREPIDVGAGRLAVTCSIGVAVADDSSVETVLQRADAALYVAKRQGRDQWVLASDTADVGMD